MELPEKICPRCRCEYMHTAIQCSDCRIPLVLPEELGERSGVELPPASELAPVRVSSVMWAREFSSALSGAGIPHRIDVPPQSGKATQRTGRRSDDGAVAIFVRPEDHASALQLDGEFARAQIPDLPDPAQNAHSEGADENCPACGEVLDPSSPECPGCALFLGEPE